METTNSKKPTNVRNTGNGNEGQTEHYTVQHSAAH